MSIGAARRKLARAVQAKATTETTLLRTGTIASATAGASADGVTAATVTLRSGTTQASAYIQAYTAAAPPQAGDFVAVAIVNGSPIIQGRIVGLPAF